jgi:DNA-binding YbaB/EbfC family protein
MNVQQAMKQMQKMQAEMARIQEELGQKTVDVSVGGGAISLTITGHLEVKSIKISQEVMDDQEMLEDLILSAVNEGIKQAQDLANREMGKVTGNMKIPGLPPGLF